MCPSRRNFCIPRKYEKGLIFCNAASSYKFNIYDFPITRTSFANHKLNIKKKKEDDMPEKVNDGWEPNSWSTEFSHGVPDSKWAPEFRRASWPPGNPWDPTGTPGITAQGVPSRLWTPRITTLAIITLSPGINFIKHWICGRMFYSTSIKCKIFCTKCEHKKNIKHKWPKNYKHTDMKKVNNVWNLKFRQQNIQYVICWLIITPLINSYSRGDSVVRQNN